MSTGLWALLAVLAAAQLSALIWRRRALRARAEAASRPGLYFLTTVTGEMHFGSNPAIPAGTIIVGQIPRLTLTAGGPLLIERDEPPWEFDARAFRLRQELRLGLEVAERQRATRWPNIITGT